MRNNYAFHRGIGLVLAWFLLSQGATRGNLLIIGLVFIATDLAILVGKFLWVLYKKPWRHD